LTALTVKCQRLLEQLGVTAAIGRGARRVTAGPTYELRKEPGIQARLVFEKEGSELRIGYATLDGPEWQVIELEPFSFRALGYYERRLKRIGDFVEKREPDILR